MPAVCFSIQGLFIICSLFSNQWCKKCPLIWQRAVEKEAYVCAVWRNEDLCAVMFKQRFPQQLHGVFVPHSHARTAIRAHTEITLRSARVSQPLIEAYFVQIVPLCMSRDNMRAFDLLSIWLRSDFQGWTKRADLVKNKDARKKCDFDTRAKAVWRSVMDWCN